MKLSKSQLNALAQAIYSKLRKKKEEEYKKKVEEYTFTLEQEKALRDLLESVAFFKVVFPNVLSRYYTSFNRSTYDDIKKDIIEGMELVSKPTYKAQIQIENDILLKTIESDFDVNQFIEEYVKENG